MLVLFMVAAASAQIPVVHGVLKAHVPDRVPVGEDVVLELSVPDREAVVHAECTSGEARTVYDSELLPAGEPARVVLRVEGATTATCLLVARFANGLSERRQETFSWTWVEPATPEP